MTVVTLTDYEPNERFDANPWTQARVEGATAAEGPFTAIETIDLDPVDSDPTNPATRNFTTTQATTESWFRVVFIDADGNEDATEPVSFAPGTFASVQDVEVRIGRDLDDAEQALADYVLRATTALIAEELNHDADWVAALTPVPPTFAAVCVTRAVDAVSNPSVVQATTESLGAYSISQTLRRSTEDFACLSASERAAVRLAWYRTDSATVFPASILEELPVGPGGKVIWDTPFPALSDCD